MIDAVEDFEYRAHEFGICDDTGYALAFGVPFHKWLTSPACEVVDVTWAMNLGTVGDSPTYHPIVVGEDFPYQSGCILELG